MRVHSGCDWKHSTSLATQDENNYFLGLQLGLLHKVVKVLFVCEGKGISCGTCLLSLKFHRYVDLMEKCSL